MMFLQIHNINTVKYLKQSAAQWCEVLWEWKLLSNIYSKTPFFFRLWWKKRMFTY